MRLRHSRLEPGCFLERVGSISETANAKVCKTQPVLRFRVVRIQLYRVFESFYGFAVFVLSEEVTPGKKQSVCASIRVIRGWFYRRFNGFDGYEHRWRFAGDLRG